MDGKRTKKAAVSEETRQALKASFLQLYAHLPLTKISIQQIADGAGSSRGGFYYHYVDVFHLLDDVENDLIRGISALVCKDDLMENVIRRGQGLQHTAAPKLYLLVLEFLEQNRTAILTLNQGSHSSSFTNKLLAVTHDNLLMGFSRYFPARDLPQRQYIVEYMASGIVATYMKWLRNGMPESKEVMAEVIMDATCKLVAPPPGHTDLP